METGPARKGESQCGYGGLQWTHLGGLEWPHPESDTSDVGLKWPQPRRDASWRT